MEITKIIIKYYSVKMLLTIDLNTLVDILISVFGESIQIDFLIMSQKDKKQNSMLSDGIKIIKQVILISEVQKDGGISRRKDLEKQVIQEGQK